MILLVALVRHRGDRPPSCMDIYISGKCWETRNSCLLSVEKKWNGSHHLIFWSLGTLTSLRDRVRRLVA